ncbi:MAG: DNA polymerase III subunit delta [Chloroflexi bacterium]|nr:MAG: DNA polymerase III subunit delta [Chloroflexota bacterium]
MATPTFYIIHGDDDLRINEAVKAMRSRMGDTPEAEMNISEFDGEVSTVGEVLSAANSFPFLADKRLVIVRGMLSWLTRKGAGNIGKEGVERLAEALPELAAWSRLVFVELRKLPANNKLVKLAQSHEYGYEKAYMTPKDSTSWIVKRARDEYAAEIDGRAAAALASVTQGDLRRADNELVKLVNYVNGERAIREDDVVLLTPYVAEASMFDMVDALAEGRGETALLLLHHLLDDGQDIFGLYGMIVRQFRLLLLTRDYLDGGGVPGGISEALNVHRFVAQKLAVQSRSFTLEQLERIYRVLLDNDLKIKNGQIKPELALDLFVASLAQ